MGFLFFKKKLQKFKKIIVYIKIITIFVTQLKQKQNGKLKFKPKKGVEIHFLKLNINHFY